MDSLLAAVVSLWLVPATQQSLMWIEGVASLEVPRDAVVFVGEEHYTPAVQNAEAELIRRINPRVVGWEFLNADDQELVDALLVRVRSGEISGTEFLALIPAFDGDRQIGVYAPVVEAVAAVGARLVALNAPRAVKRILREQGLEALSVQWRPPLFDQRLESVRESFGGYWERFVALMHGHGAGKLEQLFLAQVYTDAFMAWKAEAAVTADAPALWIAGSFHMDYGLGMPAWWKRGAASRDAKIIKLATRENLEEAEFQALMERDARDGWIADAVGVF